MINAMSAIIFDGVWAIRRKQSSSRIKLIKRLFYCFILNQAKAFLPNPFRRGCQRPIGPIHSSHTIWGANGTTMVVIFVGLLCSGWWYFPYYSYHRNPTGWEFFVPTRTHMGIPVNVTEFPKLFFWVEHMIQQVSKYVWGFSTTNQI